jgi:zinc transport system permease protein
VALGVVAVLLGLGLSLEADTPAGPSIVAAAAGGFAAALALTAVWRMLRGLVRARAQD